MLVRLHVNYLCVELCPVVVCLLICFSLPSLGYEGLWDICQNKSDRITPFEQLRLPCTHKC